VGVVRVEGMNRGCGHPFQTREDLRKKRKSARDLDLPQQPYYPVVVHLNAKVPFCASVMSCTGGAEYLGGRDIPWCVWPFICRL
jgi:hypothetical protein